MRRVLWWLRVFARDVFIHYFWGTICLLRRRHVSLAFVGEMSNGRKGGFRPVKVFQCHRCGWMFVNANDAVKLGAKKGQG